MYLCGSLDFNRLLDFYKFTFLYKSKNLNTYVVHSCLEIAYRNVKVRKLYYSCNICVGQRVWFDDIFDIFLLIVNL